MQRNVPKHGLQFDGALCVCVRVFSCAYMCARMCACPCFCVCACASYNAMVLKV